MVEVWIGIGIEPEARELQVRKEKKEKAGA
jgi:hypothetical protein